MIVGSSYMQPNLLNLTNRKILSVENDNYCWANVKISKSGKTLIVNGCYWASPYEYRFYDLTCLSDPDCDRMPIIKYDAGIYLDALNGFDDNDDYSEEPNDILYLDETTKLESDFDDTFIWTRRILYYPNLQMRNYEAEKYLEKITGLDKINSSTDNVLWNVKYNEVQKLKMEEKPILMADEIIKIKRDNDHIILVNHWQSASYIQYCLTQEAYRKFNEFIIKLWKETSKCYQNAINFFDKKTHQIIGGISSDHPGHNLVIMCDIIDNTSINTLYFQTLIDRVILEKDQVISLFGSNEADEMKCCQLILPLLDFSGRLYLLNNSKTIHVFDTMKNLDWSTIESTIKLLN
jgi:hypothetical protein